MGEPNNIFKNPFVCFASSDWWSSNPYAINHTMREISKFTRVLFINTFSSSISSFNKITKRMFLNKILGKLSSFLRYLRKVQENLYVFTPISLPIRNNTLIFKLNLSFVQFQTKIIMKLLKINQPVFWVANPNAAGFIFKFSHKFIIYVCTDKWNTSIYDQNKCRLNEYDRILTAKSDFIICVSRQIYNYYKKIAPNKAYYMPHAVDYSHFSNAKWGIIEPPIDIKNIPKPIIGFYGSISPQTDADLLYYCAKNRTDWSFVLLGKASSPDLNKLKNMPNVYWIGFKDYSMLPLYGNQFSVCIIFKKLLDEWVNYSSPLKAKEYLSMGKPVVSVSIPEIKEEFSDVVSIAETKEDFLKAIAYELSSDNEGKKEQRRNKVKNETWDRYVKKIADILSDYV